VSSLALPSQVRSREGNPSLALPRQGREMFDMWPPAMIGFEQIAPVTLFTKDGERIRTRE
jgi:hypothetical protein